MSSDFITLFMFASMMALLMTGQRVFGVIGFVGTAAALWLWGEGGFEMPFNASFQVLNWYPLITAPFFIFMGYMLSESGIANNLYRMFHVWFGPVRGGLALGTIGLMVLIAALNGLSVAGMAIGATIALPELLRHGYDKRMVTGVIQGGSSLGILIPPSVVLVLYAMIARQPVLQLWLAGIFPGLMMAAIFAIYIYVRCRINPELGPALPEEERAAITWREKFSLLREGLMPLAVFGIMMSAVRDRRDQPRRELGGRRAARRHRGCDRAQAYLAGDGRLRAQHAFDQLHVPLDHPGGALFLAPSMTGSARSRRSRTCCSTPGISAPGRSSA